MDKTGTITQGKPTLVNILNQSEMSNTDLICLVASLESKSEHPIAHALVMAAKEFENNIQNIEKFESIK